MYLELLFRRKKLFEEYIDELDAIDPSTKDERHPIDPYFEKITNATGCSDSEYDYSLQHPCSFWVDLYPDNDNLEYLDPVGFLLFSVDLEDERIYIQEAYVLPEYRNQGIMTETIRSLALLFPHNSVVLSVLIANKKAMAFWRSVLQETGYRVWRDEAELFPENKFSGLLCIPKRRWAQVDRE